jgi:hypothetical protein
MRVLETGFHAALRGRPRWTAISTGDPLRKMITRYLRGLTGNTAHVDDRACDHLNVATDPRLARFLRSVGQTFTRFA